MNQGPKAKIEIEIDDAEARRQLEALRAEYGMGGGGPGGGGGGAPGRPRVPGGGPRVLPGGGGSSGGGMGAMGSLKIAAAIAAALAPVLKSTFSDAMAPIKDGWAKLDATINKAVTQNTPLGQYADEGKADVVARDKMIEFGRQTFGRAGPQALMAYGEMQYRLELQRNQGERAARNVWADFRRPVGNVMR